MPVYLTALTLLGFYLAAVPIKFALILHIAARPAFALGASVFEGRYAIRHARPVRKGKERRQQKRHLELNNKAMRSARFKMLLYLLRRLKIERLSAQGRICASDAAATALICGSARSLEGALTPIVPPGLIRISLEPDFSSGESDVILLGMFSLRAGHIIPAALIGAWNYFSAIRSIRHGKTSH